MSTLSQFGFGGGIKSIQRLSVSQSVSGGSLQWPGNVSISSVNTAKTIVLISFSAGYFTEEGSDQMRQISTPVVSLVNSTTINVSGGGILNPPLNPGFAGSASVQVVEFN
jgi:hypothetical protein